MSPQAWPAPPLRVLAGQATASSAGFTTVNFPAGFFTATPRVTVTTTGGVVAYTGSKSASSVQIATSSASPTPVDWIAVQP